MDGRAVQIGTDVVRRAIHDALAGLLGAPGHMGGDDAVGGGEQGVILSLIHISEPTRP